jgi:uncharacterized protein with PIN domain
MKFLCDQMLGTLAKWLRLFGFDTFYVNTEIDDSKLLQLAKEENRVILTRDKQLIERGKKDNIKVKKIPSTDIDQQLYQVLRDIKIDKKNVLSRCSICNQIINEIAKNDVENKIPDRIFKSNEKFWYCSKCDKIYWIGTHYEKILIKINKIQKSL